ncbi:MAG: IS21 family transposase [Kiritimatiellaeota bacterium]|nr:IS21 family transposase [Kiritimatiellota bacterium]
MSRELKEAMRQSIQTLLAGGRHSHREIARIMGVNRKTVDRHARLPPENGPIPPAGSGARNGPVPPTGFSGRSSRCAPFHDFIVERAEERGLSATRIHQDLVSEFGFAGSYDSVKRYVRKLSVGGALPFRRMEFPPGEEAQVDFGQGAPVVSDGKKRRPHVLCVTLSHSRKSYQEVVWRQTTENFIRALENAFRHFGGVPERLVTDNLKAAVRKADWFDPELNPKIRDFAEHYGTVVLPAKPYTPEHKGKVESLVKYVQDNALKGRVFNSLAEQNAHLRSWNASVADKRIHGTTKRQVSKAFEAERPRLGKLPPDLFPCFEEGIRKVHRDGYVEVAGSFYSAPSEYCRREVWVRWDGRVVRVFDSKLRQIAIHAKVERGRFATDGSHIPPEKISALEKGPAWILSRVGSRIGPSAEAWTRALFKNRKQYGLRPALGLFSLLKGRSASAVDEACGKALGAEAFRLSDVRAMLKSDASQPEFEFMEEHPLIRNVGEYGRFAPWKGLEAPPQHPAQGACAAP